LRSTLARNPGGLTTAEWRAIAEPLATPGSELERALADSDLERLFLGGSDALGRASAEQVSALRSWIANPHRDGWSTFLVDLGRRLCSRRRSAAFAFRAALEECALQDPGLASEASAITAGFRSQLWLVHPPEPEQGDVERELVLLERLSRMPTAMDDLVLLHVREAATPGDPRLLEAVLVGCAREIRAGTWLAHAGRKSLLAAWEDVARKSIESGTPEPWQTLYRPVLEAAQAGKEAELHPLATLARIGRLRLVSLQVPERAELPVALLAAPCSLSARDLELLCKIAEDLAQDPASWSRAQAIHAALVRSDCGNQLAPERWLQLCEALVPSRADARAAAQITAVFAEYLNALAGVTWEGDELERLFLASRAALPLPRAQREFLATRLRALGRAESVLRPRVQAVAEMLSASAGGTALTAAERRGWIQELGADRAEAELLGAKGAGAALTVVYKRLDFLERTTYSFLRIEAPIPVYLGRDEVSLEQYEKLLAEDVRFEIHFKRELDGAPPQVFAWSQADMSPDYRRLASSGGQIDWASGVFGIEAQKVLEPLAERGVRLPSPAEWDKALGTQQAIEGGLQVRTPELLAAAGDKSPVPGGKAEFRGLRYGVRECTAAPSASLLEPRGSSWWEAGRAGNGGKCPIDVGLRLALDELPPAVSLYLSQPESSALSSGSTSPLSSQESR
jgi:hypothetical protein